ncbi:hypothetical protein FHU10_3905 [Serratia fonticola]|uniref:DUF2931 family protein n=1 Tax=Serratia fonticola TaxID=47917 RepID=A0A542BRG3_SERFO|nr:DUF2931 family protein [Serratia fonticola]TQI81191.1 hypothetical protein FHU09_3802 [Serratia fonticola]TQI96785.1 DUF2931 family protein [Serratia fonticola]TVZ71281.1 hypothetical protein FHU10_3905 [Serratia fonticola]
MRIGKLLIGTVFLLLLGCADKTVYATKNQMPYDVWYFTFTTPKLLPAQVTLLKLLDTKGYVYGFNTVDQPQGRSVGQWAKKKGRSIPAFNKVKSLPQAMQFCWDSIIDKKVYETTILFDKSIQEKMETPEPYWNDPKEDYYHRYMIIGLAPEGKVKVWLENNGAPDILLTTAQITTVSGEQLDMCKDVTNFPEGYEYTTKTKEFIKDKVYPYGSW